MTTKKELAEIKRGIREQDAWRTVDRRCYSIFMHMKEKAEELKRSGEIDFDVDDLRQKVHALIGEPCLWCSKKLTPKSFCLDHSIPLSRGGTFALSNLSVPCSSCNGKKGNLKPDEFIRLQTLLSEFPPEARGDIMTRLGVGGRWKR
jgi:5-methylcytosine-specific restriction endonuclease McrA